MSYEERKLFMEELERKDNETNTFNGKVLLGYDFQGWPVFVQSLKEILEELGFEDDGEKVFLKHNVENDTLLKAYPVLLEDDGMGYGVNEEYISESDPSVYKREVGDRKINVFNFFREKLNTNEQ